MSNSKHWDPWQKLLLARYTLANNANCELQEAYSSPAKHFPLFYTLSPHQTLQSVLGKLISKNHYRYLFYTDIAKKLD